MNNDDFELYLREEELFKKEQEEKEKLLGNKGNDFGYSQVLDERQEKKRALRERLSSWGVSDKDIDKLLNIIFKAELEMEKIKKKFDYKAQIKGSAHKMQQDLIDIQMKMKNEFDNELKKILERNRKNR